MPGPAKRLFIAADIDEPTRTQIEGLSRSLREALGGRIKSSWVRADRMHLTLQFFAEADAALERRITAVLAEGISEPPFAITFEGIGCFPERGAPRVLWMGIAAGGDALRRVQRIIQDRLDVAADRATFTPHLTLARFRERVARGRFAEIADFRASAGPSRIDRVTLYESRLSPGPTYLRLAEAPLRP